MPSTLRNDTRRALFLERFAKAWDKRADLTFWQIVNETLKAEAMSDEEVAVAVERFVLLSHAPAPEEP